MSCVKVQSAKEAARLPAGQKVTKDSTRSVFSWSSASEESAVGNEQGGQKEWEEGMSHGRRE